MSSNKQSCIRILHVEDDDVDAKFVEINLRKISNQEFEITRVCDLKSAAEHLSAANGEALWEVILLDLTLPDSKGLDSVHGLRTRYPNYALIVITGLQDETTALKAVEFGAQDYLLKDDLTPEVISRAIRYSLERHARDQQVAELSNYDTLTGLPNRLRFNEYLEYAINNCNRATDALTLLFIDCDKFKLINDTHGHKIGDEFLREVAYCLRNSLRNSDFVARLGGDEFVVVLDREDNNIRSPMIVAEKILTNINKGIKLKSGIVLDASCSIGIANYDDSKKAHILPEQLLHEADVAMYSAKSKGGNSLYFFDEDLESRAERRIKMLRGIMDSYRQDEFSLHYQPIVVSKSKEYKGMEALLRWIRPDGEFISPEEFVPVLEETGIIKVVGDWVMSQACNDFVSLQKKGLMAEDAWISVNVSPIQFGDKGFVLRVKEILRSTGVAPESLHLEITESLLVSQGNSSIQRMHELRELGVKLSIDDFGTGYSSMKYLKDLPVNCLKIDKSFIFNSLEHPGDNAITKAMISLAHNLNLWVVAEGVETAEVGDFLNDVSCDYLQGYFFSRPIPVDKLEEFLSNQKSNKKQ